MVALEERTDGTDDVSVFDKIIVNKSVIASNTFTDVTISNDLTMGDAGNIILNTSTGTKIGTATSQKLGFWNATPVVQQSSISDPTSDTASNNAAIDSILAVLRTIGVIAP